MIQQAEAAIPIEVGNVQPGRILIDPLVIVPVRDYRYVEVTFTSANTDQDVVHTLTPVNPENINYLVVRKDRACDIYHDQSGTRRVWGTNYIVLKSSVASATVTLLLTIPRT